MTTQVNFLLLPANADHFLVFVNKDINYFITIHIGMLKSQQSLSRNQNKYSETAD